MRIFTVNYPETFFLIPDLTIIIGITTYDALHQMHLELKSNALSVHLNLGGATHGNIVIFTTKKKYATLSPITYVRSMHPVILLIPNNATRFTSYELKQVYDKNLWVSHKVCGFEQAVIQQVGKSVDEQCILSMKNRTTGQFMGNIRQIFEYLLSTYGKISPSHLKHFKK